MTRAPTIVSLQEQLEEIRTVKYETVVRDNVIVGAGAQILGPIVVGKRGRVGANAVVTEDVPEGATMVGVGTDLHLLIAAADQATYEAKREGREGDLLPGKLHERHPLLWVGLGRVCPGGCRAVCRPTVTTS